MGPAGGDNCMNNERMNEWMKLMNRVSFYNGLGPEEKESFLLSQ